MSISKKVGEYLLKEKIGVGSFGTVYKAIKKGGKITQFK